MASKTDIVGIINMLNAVAEAAIAQPKDGKDNKSGLSAQMAGLQDFFSANVDGGLKIDRASFKENQAALELRLKKFATSGIDHPLIIAAELFCEYYGLINLDKNKIINSLKKLEQLRTDKSWEKYFGIIDFALGIHYEEGAVVQQDLEKAFKFYNQAGMAGNTFALLFLGERHRTANNSLEAFKCFKRAADLKDSEGLFIVGICYETAAGVGKDLARALAFYRESSDQGHPTGSYNAGACYQNGDGTERDIPKAISYYRKAVDLGYDEAFDPEIMDDMAGSYYHGTNGFEQNHRKAFELYEKAANLGHPRATHNLGFCYRGGIGVEQSLNKAFTCFEKALGLGIIEAAHDLGAGYEKGKGVAKDPKKAFELYLKAANSGYGFCQFTVAKAYNKGSEIFGIKPDKILCFKYAALLRMQNFQNPKEDKDQEGFWEDWESWWKNPDFGIKQATNQAELSLIAGTIIGVIKDLQQEAKSKKPACGNQVFNDIIKFAEEQQKIAEERLKQAIVDASKTSRTATKIKKPSGSLSSVDNLSTPLLSKKAGKGVASD